ncbi:hypothetical protein ISCGN_002980 [Ixodes scapularis]
MPCNGGGAEGVSPAAGDGLPEGPTAAGQGTTPALRRSCLWLPWTSPAWILPENLWPSLKWTPYADIVLELTAHFTPCLSVIVQCFAFHKCSQQPGESISNFVPAPRRFSEHCNFGTRRIGPPPRRLLFYGHFRRRSRGGVPCCWGWPSRRPHCRRARHHPCTEEELPMAALD